MSSHHVYVLRCDHEGCDATWVGDSTVSDTRQAAPAVGWASRRVVPEARHRLPYTLDFCPQHARRAVDCTGHVVGDWCGQHGQPVVAGEATCPVSPARITYASCARLARGARRG